MSNSGKTFVVAIDGTKDEANRFLDCVQETKLVAIKNPGADTFRKAKVLFIYPIGDPKSQIVRALRGESTARETRMIGFGEETKKLINRVIELSPALEAAILNIAEYAYGDGLDSAE